MVYKPATYFSEQYGLSAGALRSWAISGRLEHIRLPGGKRMYDVDGVTDLLGQQPSRDKHGYIYARVNSEKQRADLERQIKILQEAYPEHTLIKDVSAGVNLKRRGLRSLLDHALGGMVSEVVVMDRDRLARIGCDLLEFILLKSGARLVVHNREPKSSEEEDLGEDLGDDLLAVTKLLVESHQKRRAAANRKRTREEPVEIVETDLHEPLNKKLGASPPDDLADDALSGKDKTAKSL
mmetsp:Transcript_10125/g.17827  ORF Transcript_10125/g.17827 Transcript_10125/m.17827 type:complete len:238 (+) Transcript_10125:58-771(+)